MALPDGYLPREGDVLTVDCVVEHDVRPDSQFIFLKTRGKSTSFSLPTNGALPDVYLKIRTWREDEKVACKADAGLFGEVVIQHQEHVVVKLDDAVAGGPAKDSLLIRGGLLVLHCNELRSLEPESAAELEAESDSTVQPPAASGEEKAEF